MPDRKAALAFRPGRRYHPPMRTLPMAAAALLFSMHCAAADWDVSVGASKTISWRWAGTAFLDVSADTREWSGVHWQPTASVGWIGSRNDRPDHLDHDVLVGGAGVRLVDWWRGAFAGFEVAAVDEQTDALSSTGQFISSLGWQGDHYVVMFRHISNGHIFGGRNLGETMLLAGVRF